MSTTLIMGGTVVNATGTAYGSSPWPADGFARKPGKLTLSLRNLMGEVAVSRAKRAGAGAIR